MSLLIIIKNSSKLTKIITIYVLIVIIAIIFFIVSQTPPVEQLPDNEKQNKFPLISIENYISTLNDSIPEKERVLIEETLYSAAKLNYPIETASNVSATIRNASLHQEVTGNIILTDFIVDIETIKQSYKINSISSFTYDQPIDYPVTVYCLPTSQLIYGQFDCIDEPTLRVQE